MSTPRETPGPFGVFLRRHRSSRRLSQLELASRAGTTQRHLSFVESGRSAPGRELVLRLSIALQLALRDRNSLLLSAGFAPAFAESALDSDELAPAIEALQHVVAAHTPYPAIVVDRYGQLVAANRAFDLVLGETPQRLRDNVYRAALHPDGMARRISNFEPWAHHVMQSLEATAAWSLDERLVMLCDELRQYVPREASTVVPLGFAVPLEIETAVGELRLVTTISTFATAVDVTLSDLKLEAFLPQDHATVEALLRAETPAANRQ